MLLKKKDSSLTDLRRADPRVQADFEALVGQHAGMRDRIVTEDVGSADAFTWSATAAQPRRRAMPRRKTLGLSATAGIAVAAAVAAAFMLFGGGNPSLTPTPALAAEAVKKAAVDTSAAAQSGVISTVLLIDGEAQVSNTVSWNGSDLALVVQSDEQRQVRYVDGVYYETYGYSMGVAPGDTTHVDEWIHCTDYDNGGTRTPGVWANEEASPSQWLAAARTDLAGDGLVELVSGASGYTQTDSADGSTTYAGMTSVAAIQSQDWSLSGLPIASQPSFKVLDTSTAVAMKVTVGADGLIRELKLDWTLDLPGEASAWSYTTTYSELGTAAPIVAPDPAHTSTTDSRFPETAAGPM
jgi:hypothetical protein